MNAAFYRVGVALLIATCVYANAVTAQTYPAKPIRLIIPYAPGGGADVLFRFLSPVLSEHLGQQVLVDNRPGGAATVGLDLAAKSNPDGYTVGMASLSFTANPFMISKMPFDAEKDFVPVTLVATSPLVLAVHPSLPARSVKELIALAKARPNSINYASGGNASSNHLGTELFKYMTGAKMTHVPYKGGGPAVVSILSGETMVLFATIPSAQPYFKSGKLVGLAISTAKRFPTLPDIATVAEGGVPGFDMYEWQGLLVPTGTPPAVIQRLQRDVAKAVGGPEMKDRIIALGELPIGSTPDEFGAFLQQMFATWSKVVKTARIRID